ncbi:MAG: hypothetical protein QY325_16135 [Flavobacteriales bacterium]|nr:MAG: hypothetical protein QY325_16135 [Flavobacteriales bacterium]
MNGLGNPVLGSMVRGHLLLALGAAAQVRWLGEHWFFAPSWSRPVAAFLAVLACYGWMRRLRSRDEGGYNAPFLAWYRVHPRAAAWLAAGAAAGSCLALGDAWLDVIVRLLPVVLPAALYITPWRSRSGARIGLRGIPFLKSLLVAWVWAAGTVLLAHPGTDRADGLGPLLIAVFFGFYLAIAIAFDLRDLPFDPPALRTLPQVLGPMGARALALLALAPLAVMLLVALTVSSLPSEPGGPAAVDWSFALPWLVLPGLAVLIARSSPGRAVWHWLMLDASIVLLPLLAWAGSLL